MLIDTHCHIHEANYPDASGALERARENGVEKLLCVGTSNITSREAATFAPNHENVFFSIGVHPHDTKDGYDEVETLAKEKHQKLVAIGEIGLDYFYTHSPREVQIAAFEAQLQLAKDHNLPVIFHVREAFDDFWPIFHNFSGITGVLHSFTDSTENMQKGLSEGLYIGVNGISTFARDQQEMWDAIPLEKMVLETDAPFLTPAPYRGKVNEPAFVRNVAEYHANRRGVELEHLARATSANASTLFSI
jgi:TatD DNase family protein